MPPGVRDSRGPSLLSHPGRTLMWITAELLALAAVALVMVWRLDDWRQGALCAEGDPDAFFPEKGESTRAAKNICRRCLVKVECLSSALANDERFGVWGGLSDRERRRLRRMSSESPATRTDPTAQLHVEAAITTAVTAQPTDE